MHTAEDTGDCMNLWCSKPAGKRNHKRIALYRCSAFEWLAYRLGYKHGVTYCAVIPPSQYGKGQHTTYIQFPLNIMSVKTHLTWYRAGSNWRYNVMFCWYKNLNHSHYLGKEEPELCEICICPPTSVKEGAALQLQEVLVRNDPSKKDTQCL